MKLCLVPIPMDTMAAIALSDLIMGYPATLIRNGNFAPGLALDLGVLHAAQWVECVRRTMEDPCFDPSRDIF